jgi:hypothetical protein
VCRCLRDTPGISGQFTYIIKFVPKYVRTTSNKQQAL